MFKSENVFYKLNCRIPHRIVLGSVFKAHIVSQLRKEEWGWLRYIFFLGGGFLEKKWQTTLLFVCSVVLTIAVKCYFSVLFCVIIRDLTERESSWVSHSGNQREGDWIGSETWLISQTQFQHLGNKLALSV